MSKNTNAPRGGALGWCAVLFLMGAPAAMASHVGDDQLLDQQAVTSTNQLLATLRQYERTPAPQRAALAEQLAQLAAQRRDRMLALIDQNPAIAALRLLPQSTRARLPAQAQAFVEQPVTLHGAFGATVSDDFERGQSHTALQLRDDAGQRFDVRAAHASTRDQLAWVGKRGAVSAMRLDGRLLVLDKRHVQVLAAGGTTTQATPTTAAATTVQGVQNTLVVMMNFADTALACTAADVQNRLFGATGATMDQGYRQSSNNLVSFTGQVAGPFPTSFSSTGACDPNAWAAAGNAAAQAAGFNPSSYTRVSYVTPPNASCGFTGLATLGGTPPTQSWVLSCGSTGVFSHELGHNLLLHHAATPLSEYGDGTDPMGAAKLVQSNAANRVMAGWLGGSQVADVSVGGSYVISALESTAPTSPQVLRMPKADTAEYYYVSLRVPIGIDTNLSTTLQNMVSVHKATGTLPTRTYLLTTLAAGQSWSDATNGIQVFNQGVSGSAATVAVAFSGPTCARSAPTLAAAPASQSAAPGSALAYGLTVTNNNSAACPTSTFNLAQALPAGFSGTLGVTSVTVAPGASANVSWNVASTTAVTDAVYTLTASASEATAPNPAEAHASYTVVSAPVPPPPGDTTLPLVSITSPTGGAVVSPRLQSSLALAALASDNVGVTAVEFYVDGKLIASDTAAPYSATWNTRKATRGTHTVTVRARDAAGNVAVQSVSVTVQ